ncbi:MAG: hypothetical protein Q9174_002054 [Haloplaca sp. 1 TL-2023]
MQLKMMAANASELLTNVDLEDTTYRSRSVSDDVQSLDGGLSPYSAVHDVNRLSIDVDKKEVELEKRKSKAKGLRLIKSELPTPRLHYYRELGPTAIAPGYKQISIKIQQHDHGAAAKIPAPEADRSFARGPPFPPLIEDPALKDYPPLFDRETSLPVKEVLSDLFGAFFTYYADNFCFLNRSAWTLISEIWPLSNRAYGIALCASSNWMSIFPVGQITPDMLESIKYGTFLFYGFMTLAGAIFLWFGVPETKRLTLEEMDLVFGSVGVARGDSERMGEINKEIRLDDVLRNMGIGTNHDWKE